MPYQQTEALILRKTAYSESSIIIAALTPQLGQRHFLAKGARKTGKRRFPAIDLFRHVRLHYRPARTSDLHTLGEVDGIAAFNGVAQRPEHFSVAGELARFCLANTVDMVPAPQLFAAMLGALRRLAGPPFPGMVPALRLAVPLVCLQEHGLLPDYRDTPDAARQLRRLMAVATDPDAPLPDYTEAVWTRLAQWLDALLKANPTTG